MTDPEAVGPCEGCGHGIGHDERYVSIYPKFNCHGLQMSDDSITPGDYHHECLINELTLITANRFDDDTERWLGHLLGHVSEEELRDG